MTAHKLRHTFASILAALNEPMPYVMGQLGHTDPKFTMRVSAHQMRRGDGERAALAALVGRDDWADDWAETGRSAATGPRAGAAA